MFKEYDPATNVDAIWIMDLAGRHWRQITLDTNSGVTDPNVSPDGRTVTAVRYGSGNLQQALFSWSLDGTHERQLTPFATDVAIKHDWAPDGQHLVFSDNADNPATAVNIVTIRPDGSGWGI